MVFGAEFFELSRVDGGFEGLLVGVEAVLEGGGAGFVEAGGRDGATRLGAIDACLLSTLLFLSRCGHKSLLTSTSSMEIGAPGPFGI